MSVSQQNSADAPLTSATPKRPSWPCCCVEAVRRGTGGIPGGRRLPMPLAEVWAGTLSDYSTNSLLTRSAARRVNRPGSCPAMAAQAAAILFFVLPPHGQFAALPAAVGPVAGRQFSDLPTGVALGKKLSARSCGATCQRLPSTVCPGHHRAAARYSDFSHGCHRPRRRHILPGRFKLNCSGKRGRPWDVAAASAVAGDPMNISAVAASENLPELSAQAARSANAWIVDSWHFGLP
jgi:hypothetical protein